MNTTIEIDFSQTQKSELGLKLSNDFITNLTLIGFSKSQIIELVSLTINNNDQDRNIEDFLSNQTLTSETNDDDHEDNLSEIEEKADSQDFSIELRRYQKRISAANVMSNYAFDDKDLSRLLVMLDHLNKAYQWYKNECLTRHVTLAQSRDTWTLQATDEMLDQEDKIIFFDETDVFGNSCLYLIERFSDAAAQRGQIQYIDAIESKLADLEMIVPEEYIENLKEGRLRVRDRDIFIEFIYKIESGKEIPRSDLIAEIMHKTSVTTPEWIILRWIDDLQQSEKLISFKKSNRWQIKIL